MSITTPDLQPANLHNDLVRLQPLQEEDFERLYAVAADPLLWEQHPERTRYKRDVFQVFFDGAIASGSAFLIKDAQTDEVIGSSRYYEYDAVNRSIAIGYTFLARSHWGGVYNRALKDQMIGYAFGLADVVVFHVGGGNIRSQKAVEKMGGKKVSEIDPGGIGDAAQMKFVFELRKVDWVGNKI